MSRIVQCGTCLILSVAGCGATDTAEPAVSSDAIYPVFTVEADESGAVARAGFRIGGQASDTYLELSDDDVLYVETSDAETLMELEEDSYFTYVAEIPVNESGAWFNFVFERPGEVDAPYNTVVLPETIDIHRPYLDEEFSRSSDDLDVIYSPSNPTMNVTEGPMDLALTGECMETIELDSLLDLGTFKIGAGTIQGGSECTAQLEIVRHGETGYLDPVFEDGGVVKGLQRRTVDVVLVP